MPLYTQKYSNVERTVSGTVNVEQDDSVLNVDTSTIPATINLLTIIAASWSTQYKLYIFDASGNSSVNNITIVAPAGFTINAQQSIPINTNGGSIMVVVSSDITYLGLCGPPISASPPFIYAQKLIQDPATTYLPIAGSSEFSVLNGTPIAGYDSVASNDFALYQNTGPGFGPGVKIGQSGYYSMSAKMITRINATDVNGISDDMGNYWIAGSNTGFIAIALILRSSALITGTTVISSNKQALIHNISDVNIECSQTSYFLPASAQVSVRIFNKTDYAIIGIPPVEFSNLPECIIDFSIVKVA